MNRTCKACDGTGCTSLCEGRAGRAFEGHRAHSMECFPCRACDGFGNISERIPASDAIADAETLRNIAFSRVELYANCYGPKSTRRKSYTHSSRVRLPLMDACTQMEPIAQARAAFRAVPGLRG